MTSFIKYHYDHANLNPDSSRPGLHRQYLLGVLQGKVFLCQKQKIEESGRKLLFEISRLLMCISVGNLAVGADFKRLS